MENLICLGVFFVLISILLRIRNNKKTKEIDKESQNFNDGYWLEGMDRVSCSIHMIETLILDHPSIQKAELTGEIENIIEKLDNVYQQLGEQAWDSAETPTIEE